MNKKIKIAIGMSGGVDSSVSAYLLKKQGYDVFGLFMKNWEELDESGVCKSSYDYEDVLKVCDFLKINCYSVNFSKEYFENVFSPCLKVFEKGETPNPDILCNKEIKFKRFLQKAKDLGADFLATGHYAQIYEENNRKYLLRGKDLNKDQTYFLYTLKEKNLNFIKFPIGHLTKKEVREIAIKANLPTATKKESMGICFIGKRKFKPFLNNYLAFKEGDFRTLDGKFLAKHDGLAFYTIGQRKGLKVGGEGDAWYVVKKDISKNIIYLAQGENHPALFSDSLIATDISWITEETITYPIEATAKIRYRNVDTPCIIEKNEKNLLHIKFKNPQRAITPSQSIVFYKDEKCLGGGKILRTTSKLLN